MKMKVSYLLAALTVVACGCKQQNQNDEVISQRYIHKYGYTVPADEWNVKNYPGQVITSLRNGVTITSSYENGLLHGPTTKTFPHSQIVETYSLYNQGNLTKETSYDVKGMPVRERVQLSPTRYALTLWYADGTPMSVEEYANQEILEGQYFTVNNEIEARIEKGTGKRIRRDDKGLLLSVEEVSKGYPTKLETYFANGAPQSVAYYNQTKLHGEKRTFAATGEPLSIEEWINGKLHGKSTYFKNGSKLYEISYLEGLKYGMETHYLDGEVISQQIHWENDKKHGPATFYVGNSAEVEYYYNDKKLSKKEYDSLANMDEMISQISPELRVGH
jgi:antitoxin component YwqK of YwqJK toxin-antitoxin module